MTQTKNGMPPARTLSETGERARRRIARRLMPFLFLLLVIAFVDRVNVSYAALEMSRDLGFTDRVMGLGAGIFFIGYVLLEIPGALIVERWSARRWIARIMISWGIVSVLVGFVNTAHGFYTARFVLGVAEAGFFPGIIVYLTHWFRYEDRAKAVAAFMAAVPVSNIIGSPLAGLVLGVHWFGTEGWRWLFIIEGIPAIIFGVVTLAYLTDRPHQAHWLPADEKEWIAAELEREKQAKKAMSSYTVWRALRQRDVILLALIYFLAVTGNYGFIMWLPTILKRVSHLSNLSVTLLAALPYLAGLVAMLVNGWHSDLTGERRWHTAFPQFLFGLALLLSIAAGSRLWLALGLFILAGAAYHSVLPVFWSLPTITLSASAAAASIGLINAVGNLGGFCGPYVVGYLSTRTHSFTPGLIYLLAGSLLSALLMFFLRIYRRPALT